MSAHHKVSESGQAILVVLLLMAVGLTLGLSAISRSNTDVEISSRIERESSVYYANESTVENLLKNWGSITPGVDINAGNGVSVRVDAAVGGDIVSAGSSFVIPGYIPSGDVYTVWLVSHGANPQTLDENKAYNPASSIDICWKKSPQATPVSGITEPGLSLTFLYKVKASGVYKVARGMYRSGGSGQQASCSSGSSPVPVGSDCFEPTLPINCGDTSFSYGATITFTNLMPDPPGLITPIALRLKPVYGSAQFALRPQADLPRQALINAYASARNTVTGESTKILVYQGYPEMFPIFDYGMFSAGSITSQ